MCFIVELFFCEATESWDGVRVGVCACVSMCAFSSSFVPTGYNVIREAESSGTSKLPLSISGLGRFRDIKIKY